MAAEVVVTATSETGVEDGTDVAAIAVVVDAGSDASGADPPAQETTATLSAIDQETRRPLTVAPNPPSRATLLLCNRTHPREEAQEEKLSSRTVGIE
jgi:hypothetical protein